MNSARLIPYHFTVLRIVPHVHTGAFVNAAVVLHARTAEFLAMRAISDAATLQRIAPDVDTALLLRYLSCYDAICRGDASAGPLALATRSERFHWLSAPRSDVIQPSPVHEGGSTDTAVALVELFTELVTA